MTIYRLLLYSIATLLVLLAVAAATGLWYLRRHVREVSEIQGRQRAVLATCAVIDREVSNHLAHFFDVDISPDERARKEAGLAQVDAKVGELQAFADPDVRPHAEAVAKEWQAMRRALAAHDTAANAQERRAIHDKELTPAAIRASEALDAVRGDMLVAIDRLAWGSHEGYTAMEIAVGIGVVVAVWVAVSGVFVLRRTILRPTRQIELALERMESGGLDDLALPAGKTEFGRVGEALRRLAQRLHEYRSADAQRLTQTRQLTQIAIDSLPHAIAMLGSDGRVELSNALAARLFGLAPGVLIHEQRLPWLSEMFRDVVKSAQRREPQGYESAVQMFDAAGEHIYLPHLIPNVDEKGVLSGVTLVLVDATELRKIDEAKSSLISTVSHELKTPLTSIQMCVHLALEDSTLPTRTRELLVTAIEDADRLGRLVESLLDMGRIQSGRANLELGAVEVSALVDDALSRLQAALASGAIVLEQNIPPATPAVLVDRERIRHVFENVFSNAAKYTPAGGRVTVTADATPTHVRVRIADTGPGIPAEYLPQIFDRFVRVPGQASVPGAGLGLTIAREIVVAHRGEITVESTPGVGSVFTVTLPRADAT